MRPVVSRVIGLAMALVLPVLLVTAPSAFARQGEQAVFHEGQIVAITDTEVTIKEWAGKYTYRLKPGGRRELDVSGIKPGDNVVFSAWEAAEIAFDFRKR